jgi:hypothetical protein
MTIQSLAWAFDQNVPGNAKLVLLALANRADHHTGKVDFDASAIAAESSVSARSLPRYLGALRRNEYIAEEQIKQGDGGKFYWLLFSREIAMPWSWGAEGADAAEKDAGVEFESTVSPPRKFSREKQNEQRKIAATPTQPIRPPEQNYAVIEGTDAYHAWVNHYRNVLRKPPPFVMWVTMKSGKQARGFYAPSLYPPRQERIDQIEGAA